MLEHVEVIFTDLDAMLRKLKKPSYEANMEKFRREHGHYIDEMTEYIKGSDDRNMRAETVGNTFADKVNYAFSKNGKIGGRKQADLNFFMIYYVFPAILLTNEDDAGMLCDAIRAAWNKKFKDTNINYTDYDTLYSSFRNKIFGIF